MQRPNQLLAIFVASSKQIRSSFLVQYTLLLPSACILLWNTSFLVHSVLRKEIAKIVKVATSYLFYYFISVTSSCTIWMLRMLRRFVCPTCFIPVNSSCAIWKNPVVTYFSTFQAGGAKATNSSLRWMTTSFVLLVQVGPSPHLGTNRRTRGYKHIWSLTCKRLVV
jgi:hypothetical protein